MPFTKIKEFLDAQGVKYRIVSHPQAFTAQEIAASAHIPGREVAKTVMVKLDGRLAMAVLPAQGMVDFDRLRVLAGAAEAVLAGEDDFRERFPGCEVGAMPPFGNLYGLEVYADQNLAEDEEIAFNACSHVEMVKMTWKDFATLVKPKLGRLGTYAL